MTGPGEIEELRLFQQLRLRTGSLTKRLEGSQRGSERLLSLAQRATTLLPMEKFRNLRPSLDVRNSKSAQVSVSDGCRKKKNGERDELTLEHRLRADVLKTQPPRWPARLGVREQLSSQDAQNGRPARPQASRNRRRTLQGYVEDFDEPRTMLADFFSILLGLLDRFFSQRLVGLYIKSQYRLTFRKITRDGKVFGIGRL